MRSCLKRIRKAHRGQSQLRERRGVARSCLLLRLLLAIVILAPLPAAPEAAARPNAAIAPTYRIYATREGLVGNTTANGHTVLPRDRFVALPSWSVLSPAGSDKFAVRVTYNGRSIVLPVWDVGPWNTQDDYWSTKRRYRDLPVGRPMAEAAFLDGYNGGRDEQGRKILAPNGIDIADGAFLDDLKMNKDDWVYVTFLWLGKDPGPGNATPVTPGKPGPPQPTPQPTPRPAPPQQPTAVPLPPVTVEAGASAIDDNGPGYDASQSEWYSARCGLNGSHAWTYSTSDPSQATNNARWKANVARGTYELKAYVPSCGNVALTTSARYRISHAGGIAEAVVDQRANTGRWVSLGSFAFESALQVELSDLTDDELRAVRFDAISYAPSGNPPSSPPSNPPSSPPSGPPSGPPNSQVTSIKRNSNGYQITWTGSGGAGGIANYDIQVRKLPRGGWTDWLLATSTTTAWFGPDEGKHFAFRSRARDRNGNEEPWPDDADMDTTQAAQ